MTIFTPTRIIITKMHVSFLTKKKIKNSTNASTFIYLRVTPAELLYARNFSITRMPLRTQNSNKSIETSIEPSSLILSGLTASACFRSLPRERHTKNRITQIYSFERTLISQVLTSILMDHVEIAINGMTISKYTS